MSVLSVLNKPHACGDDQGGQGVDTCLITPRPGAQVTDCIKISASHGLIKGKKSFPLEIALRGIYEYSLRTEVGLMAVPLNIQQRIMLGRGMTYQYSLYVSELTMRGCRPG